MKGEWPPLVMVGTGLMLIGATLHAAWALSYPIRDWHHGLFMLVSGGVLLGYGIGGWAAQRARDERDDALALADRAVAAHEALQATVARSLRRETK